jgi:hypothetical protein
VAKRVTKGNLWGFIQSRAYTSIADIRRLFLMSVEDAACVETTEGMYFVGLPSDAAAIVAQLCREGRIVLDVNPDIKARAVQGVYPARAPFGRTGSTPATLPAAAVRPSSPDVEAAAAGQAPGSGRRRRRRRRRGDAAEGTDESREISGDHHAAEAPTDRFTPTLSTVTR